MTGRRVAALAAVVLLSLPAAARAGGEEDSPWPDTASTPRQLEATREVVSDLEDKVELMELSVARYEAWQACLTGVPVSEYGDPDRQFGYVYNERDGTGTSFMPALAVDRKSRDGREDYLFFDFGGSDACRSDAPVPGGTAEPASVRASTLARTRKKRRRQADDIAGLERRVARLTRTARRLELASEHFDVWESCVSWVPVTEYGDPDGGFGYAFGRPGATRLQLRSALAIDRSDWDDPDYMFLAFVGGDRPEGECRDEPGEGDD